jgi:hypothetical protein
MKAGTGRRVSSTAEGAVGLAERPAPAGRRSPRPRPERSQAFGHLDLAALRTYRAALTAEEDNVSYWRRILQARLDVVRAGSGRATTPFALRPVLTTERVGAGRRALVQIVPADDIPPLPNLAELWDRRTSPDDTEGTDALLTDLEQAEQQLSAYRSALHGRIAEATGELIARYREQPSLCLAALPVAPR